MHDNTSADDCCDECGGRLVSLYDFVRRVAIEHRHTALDIIGLRDSIMAVKPCEPDNAPFYAGALDVFIMLVMDAVDREGQTT